MESSRSRDRNCKGVRVHGRRRRGCAGSARVRISPSRSSEGLSPRWGRSLVADARRQAWEEGVSKCSTANANLGRPRSTARGVSPPRRGPRGQVPDGHRRRRDGAAGPAEHRHRPLRRRARRGDPQRGCGFQRLEPGRRQPRRLRRLLHRRPVGREPRRLYRAGRRGQQQALLVFGSRQVDAGNVNWLVLNAQQRVGDLAQLGNSANTQQNPFNGNPGFPFEGIRFNTSQNANSLLGASVSSVGVINGAPAFLVGAPVRATPPTPRTGRDGRISSTAGPT